MSIYVVQKLDRKPVQKLDRFEHWNRVPDSVLHDRALSFAARCIYAELAGSVHQGTVATVGQRRIAKRLGCSRQTVIEGLRDLEARKHIKVTEIGKQRHSYHLTSDVFGQKQRAGVEEAIYLPRKRLVSVRTA